MNQISECIQKEIFTWLMPIELINIKTVNKYFYNSITTMIHEIIGKRIIAYEPLLINNINPDAVISGSFILQVLTNVQYQKTDIDIYCNILESLNFIYILTKNGYQSQTTTFDYPDTSWEVLTFTKENKKIQLIISDEENINIINNFDFDIVQNYYNGSHIKIKYPKSILTKTINHFNKDSNFDVKRLVKYTTVRGYKCTPEVIDDINKNIFRKYMFGVEEPVEYFSALNDGNSINFFKNLIRKIRFIVPKIITNKSKEQFISSIFEYIIYIGNDEFIEFLNDDARYYNYVTNIIGNYKVNGNKIKDIFS